MTLPQSSTLHDAESTSVVEKRFVNARMRNDPPNGNEER